MVLLWFYVGLTMVSERGVMMIGSRIKSRRLELGLTQKELAKKVGYKSNTTVNKIELGINDITQSKVVEFAEALDTTPAYLMGWESIADAEKRLRDNRLGDLVSKLSRLSDEDLARIDERVNVLLESYD